MLSFLLDEGVVTVGTISGLFTTALVLSLKTNVVEPLIERICPHHTVSSFAIDFNEPSVAESSSEKKRIKWKLFLKYFFTWIVVMSVIYLFWKFVLIKYKNNKA